MSDITLGQILPDNGEELRDAVHVAILKARAGVSLRPGDYVIVQNGEALLSDRDLCIGVVDPFIKDYVKTGQYFFVVLKPGSVSNLRHTWTHPLVADVDQYSPPLYLCNEDDYDDARTCRGC